MSQNYSNKLTVYKNSADLLQTNPAVLLASYNMVASGNSYVYESLIGILPYIIKSGDTVEYDVYWVNTLTCIAADLTTTAGTLRDSGAVDQNGLSAHPNTNLDTYALNQWYHRIIPIPVSLVGSTITFYDIVCESNASATMTAYLRDIKITNGRVTKKIIYSIGGAPSHSTHIVLNGSINSFYTITTDWDISNHFYQIWNLNAGTGTVAQDAGGAHDLSLIATPTWGSDGYGGYVNLNGSTQWLTFADNVDFEWGTSPGYICGLFNMSSLKNYNTLFCKSTDGAANNRFMPAFDSVGKLGLDYNNTTAWTGSSVASAGVTYFYLMRANGTTQEFFVQPITDNTFNTTPVLSVSQASCGVNTDAFYIGGRTSAGNKFGGKIYRHHFVKGQTLTNYEASQLFLQFKNKSYDLRGLDAYGNPNLPTPTDVTQRIITLSDDSLYSINSVGINKIGGIKMGGVYGESSGAGATTGNLHLSKYTALATGPVTHLMARYYTDTTAGQKIKYGIYSHNDAINAPGKLLVETVEYVMKGSTISGEDDTVEVIALQSPYNLVAGQKYWMGFISDTTFTHFTLVASTSSRVTHGQYWTNPYVNGLPAAITAQGTGWLSLAIGAI